MSLVWPCPHKDESTLEGEKELEGNLTPAEEEKSEERALH